MRAPCECSIAQRMRSRSWRDCRSVMHLALTGVRRNGMLRADWTAVACYTTAVIGAGLLMVAFG